MTYKKLLDFNLANFFYVLGLWEFFLTSMWWWYQVCLRRKPTTWFQILETVMSWSLYLLHFSVLFPWRSLYFSRRDDDALKVVCISMIMMMLGECWLASRASNLITVITVGIELALTGLSDPTHSYTRAITLITTNIFNKAKSQIQIQIHRQKPSSLIYLLSGPSQGKNGSQKSCRLDALTLCAVFVPSIFWHL